MSAPMNVSFQLKKSKADGTGKAPIYARITIKGCRTEFSIKRSIHPDKWLSHVGAVKGTSEESRTTNAFLASVRMKMNEHYRLLLETADIITVDMIRNAYLGISERGKKICEVFQYHNRQVEQLVGSDYSDGTSERYRTALKHVQDFIQWKYNLADIDVRKVDYQFITEYEYYLKTVRKCSHNTSAKYITNFKKIIRICLANGWMDKDPFAKYKVSIRQIDRECLSDNEIEAIRHKLFASQRLEQVRDIFLFSCFTGLAYADVKKLTQEHIVIGIDGEKWISLNRTKTDTRSRIPLLPIPSEIIKKYVDCPQCSCSEKLLPVLSNQKMNGYLKEIADLCGISKTITFHLARHTFATTITLTNGVPIESVSKMLGHKSVRTTQQYAKVVDRKLSNDMQALKQKFAVAIQPQEAIRKSG